MKNFGLLENNWWTKFVVCFVLGAAIFVIGLSAFEAVSFSFSKILILSVSVFVSALVSKYQVKIPRTPITFLPKIVFAFWGIIWLGVAGGTLLAAAAAIASHGRDRRLTKGKLTDIAVDVLAALVSALVYYLTLGHFESGRATILAGNLLILNEVIMASAMMAITHYAVTSSLSFLFHQLDTSPTNLKVIQKIFANSLGNYGVGLLGTILLFLTFNHFGIEFGLVIVPLAIFGNLAYKIHIRSLEQKTKQITEASRMHMATVEALATSIDARDQVGIGHVRRTQIYAVGLGRVLGLGDDDINALTTGALLHDIGKLAVPDHILNKPGRLTPAEMEKTKIHSSVGASILEKVGFPYPVVPTVKYHHEAWDGSGYPEGLRGSVIPLTARILTIADAYDTLRGARPYRPAVSREDACNFLRAGAGSQFDPKLIGLFLKNLKAFEDEVESEGLAYEYDADHHVDMEIALDGSTSASYVEQIKRANKEVFTLYSLARDFSGSLSLDQTLSLFTCKVREFVPFDTCMVYLLDDAGEYATANYVDGKNEAALKGKRVKVGEGATGYVLKKCKAVENVDPALDFAFSHLEFNRDYIAMASLPLIADEKLIGAVSLYSSELAVYQDEHLRLLETISRIAADAISTSLKHAEAETNALTDPMTGLPNGRSLQMQFEKEVKRAGRSGSRFQVLVLDLDGFKSVNDTFGHKTGDKMLKEISGVIRGELRDYDFLARYGGDEFVALVPETDGVAVLELCRRIEDAVNKFILPVGEDTFAKVGVSVGSACYPNQGESFDQIIVSADKAMYLTKAFHKQRDSRIEAVTRDMPLNRKFELEIDEDDEAGLYVLPAKDASDSILDDGLIVEVDDSHIVSSSAIN